MFAATKSSKIIKYWRPPKTSANTSNIGARLKYQQIHRILASHENYGGCSKFRRLMKIVADV
jgi:hypothetical protein